MIYTINNMIVKDLNNQNKNILSNYFLKHTDKHKLEFICNNITINYKDNTLTKYNKVKAFLMNNNLLNEEVEEIFLNKFIIKLLRKLIFEYAYLLR